MALHTEIDQFTRLWTLCCQRFEKFNTLAREGIMEHALQTLGMAGNAAACLLTNGSRTFMLSGILVNDRIWKEDRWVDWADMLLPEDKEILPQEQLQNLGRTTLKEKKALFYQLLAFSLTSELHDSLPAQGQALAHEFLTQLNAEALDREVGRAVGPLMRGRL